MAILCKKCSHTIAGASSLHLVSNCPNCGNSDRSLFIRVEDEDIDPAKETRDREWLDSRRVEQ